MKNIKKQVLPLEIREISIFEIAAVKKLFRSLHTLSEDQLIPKEIGLPFLALYQGKTLKAFGSLISIGEKLTFQDFQDASLEEAEKLIWRNAIKHNFERVQLHLFPNVTQFHVGINRTLAWLNGYQQADGILKQTNQQNQQIHGEQGGIIFKSC